MALLAKMSMWGRQIQYSRFEGVCFPGVASGDKVGYPNTFKCTQSALVRAPKLLSFAEQRNQVPAEESCLFRHLASGNLLQQC